MLHVCLWLKFKTLGGFHIVLFQLFGCCLCRKLLCIQALYCFPFSVGFAINRTFSPWSHQLVNSGFLNRQNQVWTIEWERVSERLNICWIMNHFCQIVNIFMLFCHAICSLFVFAHEVQFSCHVSLLLFSCHYLKAAGSKVQMMLQQPLMSASGNACSKDWTKTFKRLNNCCLCLYVLHFLTSL